MFSITDLFQRKDPKDIPGTQWTGRDHFLIYDYVDFEGITHAVIDAQFRRPEVVACVFYLPKSASPFLHSQNDHPLILVSPDNRVLHGSNGYSIIVRDDVVQRVYFDGHVLFDRVKYNFGN